MFLTTMSVFRLKFHSATDTVYNVINIFASRYSKIVHSSTRKKCECKFGGSKLIFNKFYLTIFITNFPSFSILRLAFVNTEERGKEFMKAKHFLLGIIFFDMSFYFISNNFHLKTVHLKKRVKTKISSSSK